MHNFLPFTIHPSRPTRLRRPARTVLAATGLVALAVAGCATPAGGDTATGHFASAPGWSMPVPGAFDPAALSADVFHPCEDIPEPVFEELGLVRQAESGQADGLIYCQFDLPGAPDPTKRLRINAWDSPLADLGSDAELDMVIAGEVEGLDGAVLAHPAGLPEELSCAALLETERGTVGVSYFSFQPPAAGKSCDLPQDVLRSLYQGPHSA